MFLEVTIPDYPLRTFVKSLIYYKDYTADCNYEMILPDGSSQLIIALDEAERLLESASATTRRSFRQYWITGIQRLEKIYGFAVGVILRDNWPMKA